MFNVTMFPTGCVGVALYRDLGGTTHLLELYVWSADRSQVMLRIDGVMLQSAFANLSAKDLEQALSEAIGNNPIYMQLMP